MKVVKIFLLCCSINFLLINCTKVEDGYVIPQSAPYTLNPLNIHGFISFENRTQQILSASLKDSIWVFQHLFKPISFEEKYKFVSLLYFGIPFSYIEQVNFQKNEYNELEFVYFIPFLDDFNKNNTFDQLYFLCYNKHYSLQIRDQNKLIYPKTQLISNNDIYKEIILSDRKVNGFKLAYLGLWKLSQETIYIMFLKSNRLTGVVSKETDTLIAFNPYTCELKKIPFYPGTFIDGKGGVLLNLQQTPLFFESSPTIFYLSLEVKNGHNFNSIFNDFNRYLIVLDTNFKTIYVDTLWRYWEKPIIIASFIDSLNFYLIKKDKIDTSENVYHLYRYSLKDKHTYFKKKFNAPINIVPQMSYKLDSKVYLFGANKLSLINLNKDEIVNKDLPFSIVTGYESGHLVAYDVPFSSDFNIFKDLNNDSYPDLICRTNKNQIVGFDFLNDKILFATDSFAKPIDFSIGYSTNRKPIIIIYAGGMSNIYILDKNTFWTRLLSNYSLLTLIGIVLLGPISTLVVVVFYLLFTTFKKITTKNEILGITIFFNIGLKSFKRIYNNTTYLHYIENLTKYNVSEKIDNVNSKYLSKSLKTNLERAKRAKTIIWNTFYFDGKGEKFSLRFVVTSFTLVKLINFYLVQVYETTDFERREILFMYTNVLHRIKNGLGTVQSIFENVNYLYEKNRLDVQTSKKYLNDVYNMIYKIASNLTNMISLSNEYKPFKFKVEINKLIEKWLDRFSRNFYLENILIETNLTKEKLYVFVDENQIFSALDALVENSINSIEKNKKGIISISTFSDNRKVTLKLSDNGVGFDLNFLDNQSIQANKNPFSTGIGLKIARKIFEFHNAEMIIFSEKNKGTTVTVNFENFGERENI